ncbi:MAG TPA: hypothetical protein VFC87_05685 [Perlabentimonas sp.]|nr:hypothetical protein [Bacteroidales bacterium]MDD4673027.1 hypothetical protein [Bacteroidales bacterium]MDY0348077.1 hypothetical protein [Tenuifilaceae bacterium]HZJ74276.1 hypothetical protein [Perlabentimonas sp.]
MLKNNIVIIFVVFFFIVGCKVSQKEVEKPLKEKQEIAEEAITAWIINTNEYLYYKPVVFGELSARYVRNNQTLPLLAELTSVVDSLQDEVKADSLRRELKRIEGGLLGYLLVHRFEDVNIAGETIYHELLFFLDTGLHVASALPPESFDHILDERVFFRPESDFE